MDLTEKCFSFQQHFKQKYDHKDNKMALELIDC